MVRVALFGCGWIQDFHARAVQACGGEVVAVANHREESALAFAERHGIARVTTDWETLASAPDVDAGVVATPNALHAPQSIALLEAGKHVMVEKPMAMTVADCEAMDRACRKAGVVLQIGFVRHFCNEWLKLREIIQSGMIGRPVVWRSLSGGSGAPTPWFFDKEIGGGPFIDGAVHSYDFARFTFGEATNVVTDIRRLKADTTAWDTGTVIVNFASGDQQITCWSWGLPGFGYGVKADSAHDVLGTLGSIMFPGGNQLQVNLADGEHMVEFEADTGTDWFRNQMAHFLHCCRTGEQPVTGAKEGLEATRIAEAALSVGDRPAIIQL